jgi:hypothetical protein
MRWVAAWILIGALASGCTYRSSKIAAITGGAMVVAGAGVAVYAEAADRGHAPGDPLFLTVGGVFGLALPGAIIGLAGLVGMAAHSDPPAQ